MRRWIAIACLGGLLAGLAACNLPSASTPTVGGVDYIRTAAAQTLDAIQNTMVVPPGTPVANPTSLPGQATDLPLFTPTSSPEPGVTATPQASQMPCDQASFIRDVTIPDGTLLKPGTPFQKTWELKNSGSCAWNSLYSLVFANQGDLMGGAISQPVVSSGVVQPGETVNLSVAMTAPANTGDYKGYWQLRNPGGTDFSPAGKPFWVAIKVTDSLVLIDNLCSAEWQTGAGVLSCPGHAGDPKGSVTRVDTPKFSTGYQDDEPALALEPQQVNDGTISGTFPPFLVNNTNTQFRTAIACAYGLTGCDAQVTITAQVGNDPVQILGEWHVTSSSDLVLPRIDLAPKGMAGKAVVLRFSVKANGSPGQDRVYILNPGFFQP